MFKLNKFYKTVMLFAEMNCLSIFKTVSETPARSRREFRVTMMSNNCLTITHIKKIPSFRKMESFGISYPSP